MRLYAFRGPWHDAGGRASAPSKGPHAWDRCRRSHEAAPAQKPATADAGSILMLIAQIGTLKEKGILTEEEFAAKKAELLSRL